MLSVLDDDLDADLLPSNLARSSRTLEPSTTLYEAGNDASSIYLVHQGVLKAIVPTSLGRDRIADLYGPGDVLGTAAIEGGRHAETVLAVQESVVTPLEPMQTMNERKLREHILRSMARQLRRSRELIDDAELPVGARVTRTFLRLCERFGQPSDSAGKDSVKLPLALTHEDLASLTGSSRVTITRILGELRNEGALVGTRGVYIASPKKLEAATDGYVMQVI
jgi:CRP/FNR family transcriptional regulator